MKTFKCFTEEMDEGLVRKVKNAYHKNRRDANQNVSDKRNSKYAKKAGKVAKKASKSLDKVKGARGDAARKTRANIRKARDRKMNRINDKSKRKTSGFDKRADKHQSKIKK